MATKRDELGLDRREFIIRLGGGAAGLGLFMLFPALVTGCNSSIAEGKENGDNDTPFSPGRVVDVYITMTVDDWEYLIENATDEDYTRADMWYDGTLVSDIAIRAKGNTSFISKNYPDSVRYSLKADINLFNTERNLNGFKKLNFNNCWGDPAFMREVLSYELFSGMDIPAPQASFVDLWVNDTHLGLYTMVEQVDKVFISSRFDYTVGNLYKPETPASNLAWTKEDLGDDDGEPSEDDINIGGGSLQDIIDALSDESGSEEESQTDSETLLDEMGLKTNESKPDHSLLYKLLDALNNEPDETFPEAIEAVLDVDEVLRYLAVSTILVNLDSYIGSGENYYLYDNDGRFVIIPWDLNMSFGTYNSDLSTDEIINFYIDEPTAGAMSDKPLVNRLLSCQPYLETYHGYLEELLDGAFDVDTMDTRIDEVADLIRPYVESDENKFYTAGQFEEGINGETVSGIIASGKMGTPIGLKHFVNQRSRSVRAQLDGELASGAGDGSGNVSGANT